MNPNIYELSKMTKEQYDFIMKRAELDITEQMKVAKEVSDDVKARGDEAVLEYTAKFDRVQLTADKMKVTPEEIEAGYNNLDKETREAIEYAYKNIYDFHEKQLPEEMWFTYVCMFLTVRVHSHQFCVCLVYRQLLRKFLRLLL